jgi:hypothetical protein
VGFLQLGNAETRGASVDGRASEELARRAGGFSDPRPKTR